MQERVPPSTCNSILGLGPADLCNRPPACLVPNENVPNSLAVPVGSRIQYRHEDHCQLGTLVRCDRHTEAGRISKIQIQLFVLFLGLIRIRDQNHTVADFNGNTSDGHLTAFFKIFGICRIPHVDGQLFAVFGVQFHH